MSPFQGNVYPLALASHHFLLQAVSLASVTQESTSLHQVRVSEQYHLPRAPEAIVAWFCRVKRFALPRVEEMEAARKSAACFRPLLQQRWDQE